MTGRVPLFTVRWIIPPMKILKSTESMQSMERQGRMAPVDLTDHPDANGSGYYEDGIWRFTSNGQNGDGKTYYYEYDVAGWKCLKKRYCLI